MSKKRSRQSSDEDTSAEVTWQTSKLKELNLPDVDQLLLNRGISKDELKNLGKKSEKIKHLMNSTDMELKESEIDKMKVREVIPELKVRGINSQNAKKTILVDRLKYGKAESDEEPPKKRAKTGKKRRSLDSDKIWVALFAPHDDGKSDCEVRVVGVYSTEKKAYERANGLLLMQLKDKNSDIADETQKKIDKEYTKKEFKKSFNTITQSINEVFDKDFAPYANIYSTELDQDMDVNKD